MMPDIPPIKTSKLKLRAQEYVTAAEAVREGIATHVQKHRAAQRKAREQAAAQRKLTEGQ